MVRSLRKSSSKITVGDRPIEELAVRQQKPVNKRALAAEERDWKLVTPLLEPEERPLARVSVRFTEERKALGFAYLTDRRLMFEFHRKVISVGLAYIVYAGRPQVPSSGDFIVEAVAPAGYATQPIVMTMRIRDREAFHDFFPTLVHVARDAGADVDVDAAWDSSWDPNWDSNGDSGVVVPAPRIDSRPTSRPSDDDGPPPELVRQALSTLLRPAENVVADALLVHNLRPDVVQVIATNARLIVIDGPLIWAAELKRITVIDGGGLRKHLRLLVDSLNDWRVIGNHTVDVDPSAPRRLVLRAKEDLLGVDVLHHHLVEHADAVLENWPTAEVADNTGEFRSLLDRKPS